MNFAVKPDERRSLLVAGQENHCQMYIIHATFGSNDENIPENVSNQNDKPSTVRNRKRQSESNGAKGFNGRVPTGNFKQMSFEIKLADSIQTDFFEKEPLQRVVRISLDGTLMATGGLDGHIRVWNFPRVTPFTDISGHAKEIDDLDFSPDNRLLVSVSKDSLGIIWNLQNGQEANKLTWTPPAGIKYLFKRCRFATIEGRKDKFRLFTLSNPLGKSGKQTGFLQQWNIDTGKLNKIVEIDESLSALTVREDGRFVAIGTMFTGSVSIYIAFSLQRVLHVPNAHSMFVTGITFLPVTNIDGPAITSPSEAAVVSISVDNRVCIHSLQYRRK